MSAIERPVLCGAGGAVARGGSFDGCVCCELCLWARADQNSIFVRRDYQRDLHGNGWAVSLLAGALLRHFCRRADRGLCFALLFLLGVAKLCDSAIKTLIRRHKRMHRQVSFSVFSLKFILDVYADPEKADRDGSRVLSPAEAASLAVALSLDGLAVGFGAALMQVNVLIVMLFSLAVGMLAVRLGGKIGNRAAQKLSFDLSWFSGALLIVLAILKL